MTDPTVFAGAAVTVIGALTIAVVTVINAVSKAKREMLDSQQLTRDRVGEVKELADGNFSAVKAELASANQRIAVLTERLLTTTAADPSRSADAR